MATFVRLVPAVVLLVVGCDHLDPPPGLVTITGETMGTTYTIKIAGLPRSHPADDIKAAINDRLEDVDRQMSTWRVDSEISRFNIYNQTDWFPVSEDTATVAAEAQRISDLSGGAFDITVGPLVNLWTFGPEQRPHRVPSDAEIAEQRRRVGFNILEVRNGPPALRKLDPTLAIDFSAIAPGFAVDKLTGQLNSLPCSGYMVELGGEVRCKGTKADGRAWRIGIQSPQDARQVPYRVVTLDDQALATSGDYRQYFEKNGQRYSHTIDPRTGRPIEHRLASVTVLADSCMTADALATALMVLGPTEGFDIAERNDVAILMLIRTETSFVEKTSPAFERQFGKSKSVISPEPQNDTRLPAR